MIDIYSYNQTVELFLNSSTALRNTTMFNDKIKLYKNLNTTLTVRIRDKDRVMLTPNQVVLAILDQNKVELLQVYLDFVESGKNYVITINGGIIANFPAGEEYFFTIFGVDENNNTFPLYLDHDFNIHGPLWIVESRTPTFTSSYSELTEVALVQTSYNFSYDSAIEGHTFNKLFRLNEPDHDHLYKQVDYIRVDDKTIDVTVLDSAATPEEKTVYLLKHNSRHFPVNTDAQVQWSVVQVHNDVSDKVVIEGLGVGNYMVAIGSNGEKDTLTISRKYIK